MMKTYSELKDLPSFIDRFQYLKLHGIVGAETFGLARYLNQVFYRSKEWKEIRRKVIIRDNGCDLGIPDREIAKGDTLMIHHINPITLDDIIRRDPKLFDLDNLICCSEKTHRAIHYGDENLVVMDVQERRAGDTCPWTTL